MNEPMKEPTKEQIKEFWEWCGMSKSPTGYWYYPDYSARPDAPELDLNNLFKWAVPKLYELGWEYEMKGYTYHIVNLYKEERRIASKGLKDPSLTLFWAIWELIK